ncbi:hypothetical protein Tco_0843942 [Tanacetum coccineum]
MLSIQEFKERMQKYTRFDAQSFKYAMICNMDSIGKYMLKIFINIRAPQLKTPSKSVKRKLLRFLQTKDVHAIKYKMSKSKKDACKFAISSFNKDTGLQVLSKKDLKALAFEQWIQTAFIHSLVQDVDTLQQAHAPSNSNGQQVLVAYNLEIEVKHFKETLLQHMGNVKKSITERTRHQRQYDRRVNKRQMQTQKSKIDTGKAVDADLVVTESSGTKSKVQDDSNKPGNDTYAEDADIRPIYDEEPMAEVQLTAECNIFAIRQQHTKQPEIINKGRVDQYPKQCQVKSPMLDSSPDN